MWTDRSGFRRITTYSPTNFTLVGSYGAKKVFNHHSPTVIESIRAYTKNRLRYMYVVNIIAPSPCPHATKPQ